MKKMKIGIISINIHSTTLNLATPLHSFAFQAFLEENGIESTIIDYKNSYSEGYNQKHPLFHYIDHPDKNPEKQQEKLKKWKELFFQREIRYEKWWAFVNKYCKVTKQGYTLSSLETNDPGFDCYVCVTDVIWKYIKKWGFDKGHFLASKTMDGKKKIAYSASKGPTTYTPEQKKQFLGYIGDFDYIAAREQSLSDVIKEVGNLEAPVVLDPVFLKDKKFYSEIAVKPKRKKKFVVLYLAMEKNKDLVIEAAEYAKRHDLDFIELSDDLSNAYIPEGSYHEVQYDTGIDEWLGYILEAEAVFTNSFHSCCFSLIFEKQFFAGSRAGDKIDNVLETFDLSWRRTGLLGSANSWDMESIDYAKVRPILKEKVNFSSEWLLNAVRDTANRPHTPLIPAKEVEKIIKSNPKIFVEQKKSTKKQSAIKKGLKKVYSKLSDRNKSRVKKVYNKLKGKK